MMPSLAMNPKERERREKIRKERSDYFCNWCYKEKAPDTENGICSDCMQGVKDEISNTHIREQHSKENPDYYCPVCRRKNWI